MMGTAAALCSSFVTSGATISRRRKMAGEIRPSIPIERARTGGSSGRDPSPPRRLPIGAEVHGDMASFRVWAPKRSRVEIVLADSANDRGIPLDDEGNGYFSGALAAKAGTRYWLRLDGEESLLPDPVSRFQPDGPHGPSELIDPSSFRWRDADWTGSSHACPILYEMHIGTFTSEGTWASAIAHLDALRDLGVTMLEVMPVAEFAGRFGWGYDGVDLFAPLHVYGRPDDFRRFVDAAHAADLSVILDVVYNHLGPDGNYLPHLTDTFFTNRYACEWGDALNFDGEGSAGTREFILSNARYWIEEFHLDGLRLDATQQIFDSSPLHILAEIGQMVRRQGGRQGRRTYIVCENEPQDVRLVQPAERGGYGLDALWNDDFHHSAVVAATGESRAYFSGFLGSPQEFVSAAKHGFLYQGQPYAWQEKRRGSPTLGLPPDRFVNFIQNHDQVANTGSGERLHRRTVFGIYKALTALMLLIPGTPMLFQGQEFAASAPFLYFCNHNPALAEAIRKGRAEFLSQFPNLAGAEAAAALPDPCADSTFERCILDHAEQAHGRHAQIWALHRDVIRLRATDGCLAAPQRSAVDGAVLSDTAFVLRWFGAAHDVLLTVNLGRDLRLGSVAEPLLAPRADAGWQIVFSSEDNRYGGRGTFPVATEKGWHLPAHSAVALKATAPLSGG
jgi:maltooligosyltrehalose trehalohydrolase